MLALEPNAQVASSTNPVWPNLDRDVVMTRLAELKANPNLINQGALGLCGEATFYHHVLQRDLQRNSEKVLAMAKDLFNNGVGKIGDLTIKPRETLRKANYGAIKAAYVPQAPNFTPMPPQADWMLLTALRDSSNILGHHYEGKPDESKAEGSTIEERFGWYTRCGLYNKKDVVGLVLPPFDADEIIDLVKKTSTNHILMDINEAMIRAGFTDEHTISLESILEIDVTNNWVKFQYWSWGSPTNFPWNYFLTTNHDPTHVLKVDDFVEYFSGAIIAPFTP